ncbi:MAG: AAA family ATPase [Syntrophotaleaceae bacterium]
MIEHFREAMDAAGISPPPEIHADGARHRFHVPGDSPGKKNGWYILYPDGLPAGVFGTWKEGGPGDWHNWTAKPENTLSPAEKAAYRARMEAARAERDRMQAEIQAEARKRAAEIWKAAEPAPADHPYLFKKGIESHGVRMSKGSLVVPLRDCDGTLQGLQFITPDGGKKYLTGTRKAGAYFAMGGRPAGVLYLCEGFATGASIHQATGGAVAVAFDAGNLRPVAEALRDKFPGLRIVVCADNDQWTEGNPGASKAREAAEVVGGLLALPTFQETTEHPTDFNDLHRLEGLEEARRQIELAAREDVTPKPARLKVVDIVELLSLQFPPRENLLSPWLPQQGLCMVFAPRGIGKTHFSLGVSYAVASGGTFLNWTASRPRGVLFLDGEMPGVVLQERMARIATSSDKEPAAPLRIITPDLQPRGMINLSDPVDQAALDPFLDGIDLIVVDNLSTLCRSGKEAEGESWLPVQQWALQQRAAGRSVLFIHHSGKNGEQRGTSRREDVLDTVIALRRPGDYTPDRGASFEVHFEKARGIYGEETKPFEATLITDSDGRQTWAMKELEASTAEKVARLMAEGVPQAEIGEMLGITKGAVSKAKKRAQEMGLLI